MRIIPVILAGGSGSRLWPATRPESPKQFQSFGGADTLLGDTLARLRGDERFGAPIITTGFDHRAALSAAENECSAIVFEPSRRNTAPAVAAAALVADGVASDAVLAVLPADHAIDNPAAFRALLLSAARAAKNDDVVLVGITPRRAETGYGYLELGDAVGDASRVVRFIEKPDRETAERFVASGNFAWNAGIVVAQIQTLLGEMRLHCPDVLTAAQNAVAAARRDGTAITLDEAAYRMAPNISLDYALLEKSQRVVAVRGKFEWSDLGSWASLWATRKADAKGNVIEGDVAAEDCRNTLLRSDGGKVAAIGLENMIVAQSGGTTLVVPMDRAQDVGRFAQIDVPTRAHQPKRLHRPWGYMDYLHAGDGFQVKRLVITPGSATSLQSHNHRAEHMTVVSGLARIESDDVVHIMRPGQSIDIPCGAKHRLGCEGSEACQIVEVWLGDELREDDIVRYEDKYGRVPASGT